MKSTSLSSARVSSVLALAAIVSTAVVLTGQTESVLPSVLFASPVRRAPVLDGRLDDPAWVSSRSVTVAARGVMPATRGSSAQLTVRAAYDDENFYLAANWSDDTRDDQGHRSWRWDASRNVYVEGPDREDMLAVAFEHTGALVANTLAGLEASWDLWHWMAFRTNPQGYAMDRMHVLTTVESAGVNRGAARYLTADGRDTWVSRPEDAGDSVSFEQAAPLAFAGDSVPRFKPGRPSGSAADVRAKGEWRDRNWTVEFARRLDTRHDDDTRLNPSRGYRMAMSVHDRRSGMDKSTPVIVLRFRGRATQP